MNHVFLSGITERGAQLVSRENETPHAILLLNVTHRTLSGVEKKEQYPLSAWRGTAQRLAQLAKPGTRITIKGYLSQRKMNHGVALEVTVEEFQATGGFHQDLLHVKRETEEKKEEIYENEES